MDCVNIKFLRTNGKEHKHTFARNTSVKDVRAYLRENWPKDFGELKIDSEIRFIFMGKFVTDEKTLQDLKLGSDVTLHVSVKENTTAAPPHTHSAQETQPAFDYHMHSVLFDETEYEETLQIFQKKQENGRMKKSAVDEFVQRYWRFLKLSRLVDPHLGFPQDRYEKIWTHIRSNSESERQNKDGERQNGEEGVDFNQFRNIFFIFSSNASLDMNCPHGDKERMLEATKRLHEPLQAQYGNIIPFRDDIFEKLFKEVDVHKYGTLSCAESELLFYLYSAEIVNATKTSAAGAAQ